VALPYPMLRRLSSTSESRAALCLATGMQAIRPPLPGIDLPSIFVLWTMLESRTMRQAVAQAVRAVMVSGGLHSPRNGGASRLPRPRSDLRRNDAPTLNVSVRVSPFGSSVCEKGSQLAFSMQSLTRFKGRYFRHFLLRKSVPFNRTLSEPLRELPSFPLRCYAGPSLTSEEATV
jgi:hypothetical protein